MNLFEIHKDSLEKYCAANDYSIEKVKALPKCGNKSALFVQVRNGRKGKAGLNDESPAEIVLSLTLDQNGKAVFEKGKNADKYLK